MNPAQLLAHFDRIAEAPDAVPRLRRFVLDLAVRGKLVEQDPEDEPASELLKRIHGEKERLIKSGKIRRHQSQRETEANGVPFALPNFWVWARLGDVIHLVSGQHLQPDEYSDQRQSGLPYVTGPADFGEDGLVITRYARVRKAVATQGQILLTVKGAGVGKTAICDLPEVAISRQLMAMTAIEWSQRFLLLAAHRLAAALKDSARSLIPGISREDVDQFTFGLPPLAEQHRIVAKVDELMALCDELEAAQAKREKRRDRLVAATLHGLNNGDASPAPNARFTFHHLPRLTTRPEHIQQLRQTILNLAVRGKLVPQHSEDGGVAGLVASIQKGRERILEDLGLRRQAGLAEVDGIDFPYDVPDSWAWSRIDDCFVVTGGIQKTPKRTPQTNAFPYIGVGNVYRGRLDLSQVKQFELNPGELEKSRLEPDDLLIVEGNGSASEVGRCARWTGEIPDCVHQNHIIRCRPGDPATSRFTELYLNSEIGVRGMRELAVTTAGLYNLSVGKIRKIPIPLPPLAEQHRIVAKVDELMALCDALEAQLTTAANTRRQLLEAAINEALAD